MIVYVGYVWFKTTAVSVPGHDEIKRAVKTTLPKNKQQINQVRR